MILRVAHPRVYKNYKCQNGVLWPHEADTAKHLNFLSNTFAALFHIFLDVLDDGLGS